MKILKSLLKSLSEFFQILAIFSLVFLIIYFFVGQLLEVTGDSMYPNFHDKEQIIAEKISVGFLDIKRGDIVIFKHPSELDRLLIKRVIGLPGEKMEIKEGNVYINGEKLNEPYLPENSVTVGQRIIEEGAVYTIPKDSYVMMGDNREKSTDSREWGYVKKDMIVGKGVIVYYPLSKMRLIKGVKF